MVGVLFCWRPQQRGRRHLPVEQFGSAIRTGFRHAKNNPHLQATMVRAAAFFLFATAYGALLPLIAREQIAGGPDLFGFILAIIGAGAVGGAFALRWLESKLGADWLVAAGAIGTAVAMVLFAVARGPALALLASVIAGAGWTVAVATLNVSAQIALPDWVRGRGLAMFATVLFGATAAGSAIWGQAASMVGLPGAQFIAAAGLLAAIPLTWRWKLGTGAHVDLTPSMHWPDLIVTHDVERHEGPVLVTVEYRTATNLSPPWISWATSAPAQRRLRLGRLRGLCQRGADVGDLSRRVLARTLAPARTRDERRSRAAGPRQSIPDRGRYSKDHALQDGKLAITRAELRPKITWSGNRTPSAEELGKMHHAAHENCFIANSVKTNVTVAER